MEGDAGPGRRSRAALPVLVVVGLGLLGWAVVTSPIFGVDDIVIRGTAVLPRERVVQLSGVEEGENLLFLSTEDLARRLRTSPWVKDVEVQRSLPATLVLIITERVPVAWVEAPNGRVPVAADGTVLGRSDVVPPRLPTLEPVAHELLPGAVLPGADEVLRVAGSLPQDLRRGVSSIAVAGGEVVLRLRPRGRVLYGAASSLGRKNEALSAALRWAEDRGLVIAYVDVRIPERPAVRPVGETPVPPASPG